MDVREALHEFQFLGVLALDPEPRGLGCWVSRAGGVAIPSAPDTKPLGPPPPNMGVYDNEGPLILLTSPTVER